MDFVKTPNLPQGRVVTAVISKMHQDIINSLESHGVKCIAITPCSFLDLPINSHADMLVHHLGYNRILVAQAETDYVHSLIRLGFEVTPITQGLHKKYPADIPLNAARIGNLLFCNELAVAAEIANYCLQNAVEIIQVKQGYAKCSTSIVSIDAVITSDRSIAEACVRTGLDVLKICEGHITLEGYASGFIGGCCGLIDKDVLAFTGDVHSHPDGDQIIRFLKKHKVRPVSLISGELIDIGSILPLMCI